MEKHQQNLPSYQACAIVVRSKTPLDFNARRGPHNPSTSRNHRTNKDGDPSMGQNNLSFVLLFYSRKSPNRRVQIYTDKIIRYLMTHIKLAIITLKIRTTPKVFETLTLEPLRDERFFTLIARSHKQKYNQSYLAGNRPKKLFDPNIRRALSHLYRNWRCYSGRVIHAAIQSPQGRLCLSAAPAPDLAGNTV